MIPTVIAGLAVFTLGCALVIAIAGRARAALGILTASAGLAIIAAALAVWGDLDRPHQCRSGSRTHPEVIAADGSFVRADCPKPSAGLYSPF